MAYAIPMSYFTQYGLTSHALDMDRLQVPMAALRSFKQKVKAVMIMMLLWVR
jgi:hypothetical protein